MGHLQTAPPSDSSNEEVQADIPITTWNGAKSYASVNDPLVELYFKSVRDIPCTDYSLDISFSIFIKGYICRI